MKADCIEHKLAGDRDGYGRRRVKGRMLSLHRLSFCEANGLQIDEIDGQVVRHSCDNPRCINPAHLSLGSVVDNNHDKSKRRRHPDVKLTEAQVAEIRAHCQPNPVGVNKPNPFSYTAMGRKFGVRAEAVREAYLGMTFKFLPSARASGKGGGE